MLQGVETKSRGSQKKSFHSFANAVHSLAKLRTANSPSVRLSVCLSVHLFASRQTSDQFFTFHLLKSRSEWRNFKRCILWHATQYCAEFNIP